MQSLHFHRSLSLYRIIHEQQRQPKKDSRSAVKFSNSDASLSNNILVSVNTFGAEPGVQAGVLKLGTIIRRQVITGRIVELYDEGEFTIRG